LADRADNTNFTRFAQFGYMRNPYIAATPSCSVLDISHPPELDERHPVHSLARLKLDMGVRYRVGVGLCVAVDPEFVSVRSDWVG
jgi:hypothetical protein